MLPLLFFAKINSAQIQVFEKFSSEGTILAYKNSIPVIIYLLLIGGFPNFASFPSVRICSIAQKKSP